MKVHALRGVKLGCLGSLGFLIAPLVLGAVIAVGMGLSTGDLAGSRALGFGALLLFVGNGSIAAFVALATLAAIGTSPTRGTVVGVGAIAGLLFTVAVVQSPWFTKAWLLPFTSALIVLAIWFSWHRIRSA